MNRSLCVVAGWAMLAAPAWTQPAEPLLRTELAPLEFLAGRCFAGVFPGSETYDVHCFEPVFGGQFLRDVHAVPRGAETYRGETLYHWDADGGAIRYRYYNSLGGISDGTARPEGEALRFPDETYRNEEGQVRVFSTFWEPVGETGYRVTTSEVIDGEAEPGMVVEFEEIPREDVAALVDGGL